MKLHQQSTLSVISDIIKNRWVTASYTILDSLISRHRIGRRELARAPFGTDFHPEHLFLLFPIYRRKELDPILV